MARKQPPAARLNRRALPQQGMEFAGGSSGVLDTSALPPPQSSLAEWFTDPAAVEQFSQPVKPR